MIADKARKAKREEKPASVRWSGTEKITEGPGQAQRTGPLVKQLGDAEGWDPLAPMERVPVERDHDYEVRLFQKRLSFYFRRFAWIVNHLLFVVDV